MKAAQKADAHDEYKLDKEANKAHHDEAQCGLQADLVEFCKANGSSQPVYFQPCCARATANMS